MINNYDFNTAQHNYDYHSSYYHAALFDKVNFWFPNKQLITQNVGRSGVTIYLQTITDGKNTNGSVYAVLIYNSYRVAYEVIKHESNNHKSLTSLNVFGRLICG